MLRATIARLGVSPFAMFLYMNKGKFTELTIAKRGKKLGQLWRGLSENQKQRIKGAGQRFKKPVKRYKKRGNGPYNNFVKENYSKLKGTFTQRCTAMGKLYRAQQAAKKQ